MSDYGCPCGFGMFDAGDAPAFSMAWCIAHKVHHLAAFPLIAEQDPGTVDNLDFFITLAANREGRLL